MSKGRVIVVGAGLAGLATAVRLLAAGRDVLVVEERAQPGGQIATLVEGDLVVEQGAEGFVARSQAVPALCAMLGLESALVEQLTTDTYEAQAGTFVLLPPGEAARRLGFQVPEEELGRGIRSLARGMGQLTGALVARLGEQRLRLATPATAVRRGSAGLELELGSGERLTASQLVLAAPARRASALLEPLQVAGSAALAGAATTSNVSVNLLYGRDQLANCPPGSGLLFPHGFASLGLRALSVVHHKFAGRAPVDRALLRVFFRPRAPMLGTWSDERFASEAAQAVAQVLTVSGEPRQSWVSRWVDALPIFEPAYRERVAELDVALQGLGVHVSGSSFHGAGVDRAVASAEQVAARILG